MRSARRILHASRTPLVAAPAKVVTALNLYTDYEAALILAQDYPKPLTGLFVGDSILYSDSAPISTVCEDLVRRADLIHIHNDVPRSLLQLVRRAARPSCRFVYQVHSPLREGPIFFDRSEELGFELGARLAIPHCAHRFLADYRMVPNLILFKPSVRPIGADEPMRVIFSPAHRRTGGRWNDKVSEPLERALGALQALRAAEVLDIKGMTPAVLTELRRSTHVTIDEIVTGAFHQVSLEGLATGNAVVNNADFFAVQSLKMVCGTTDEPPFVRLSDHDVGTELLALVRDRDRLRRIQQASHDFFMAHLRPDKLIRHFSQVYDEVLDAAA
jgi:hypothetical protein